MTKKDVFEGGLTILGVGFFVWGAIYLIINAVGWIYCTAVGNQQTLAVYFAPEYIRMILANVLQCLTGYLLIVKHRKIAGLLDSVGQKG